MTTITERRETLGHSEATGKTRLCLFGASPDTGNLGVSALWHSAASGLASRVPGLELTVFDMQRGVRDARMRLDRGEFPYRRIGANYSKRYYRSDSLWNMWMTGRMGGSWNPGVRAIREAHAVLDVSGGDSFSDIYGSARFKAIAMHKQLAMQNGTKLILLPQTYGPFRDPKSQELAAELVRYATAAWARDERSLAVLADLLGDDFDPARHHSGVDMAFGLDSYEPRDPVSGPAGEWLGDPDDRILVGINVSGLLYGKFESNVRDFGFRATYSTIIHELIRRLLAEDERIHVILVPHVYGAFESDPQACSAVLRVLCDSLGRYSGKLYGPRLCMLEDEFDQSEIKWVISKLDWFCGTRMHSAIAGLSSGVPVAGIAYSPKTAGVFETCDQGDCVADPREHDTLDVIDKILDSFRQRASSKKRLHAALPRIKAQVSNQMDAIVASCC